MINGIAFVTGKLGAGKGIFAARSAREYFAVNRKVAANYELNIQHLTNNPKATLQRIPDHPRPKDLISLGSGFDDDNSPGLLILDELAAWFNSRSFRDKDRLPLIDWFLHARKHGWNILFLVQSIDVVDKQLIETLCEYQVELSRMDKLKIPLISDCYELIMRARGKKGQLSLVPHINKVAVYYGKSKLTRQKVESDFYDPKPYFGSYDTNYVFNNGQEIINGAVIDMRASYTLLHADYFKPKEISLKSEEPSAPKPYFKIAFVLSSFILGYFFFGSNASEGPESQKAYQPQTSLVSQTYIEPVKPSKPALTLANYKSTFSNDVFISGSTAVHYPNTIIYTYSFVTSDDSAFYPESLGLSVHSITACYAKLQSGDFVINVRCVDTLKREEPHLLNDEL